MQIYVSFIENVSLSFSLLLHLPACLFAYASKNDSGCFWSPLKRFAALRRYVARKIQSVPSFTILQSLIHQGLLMRVGSNRTSMKLVIRLIASHPSCTFLCSEPKDLKS